MEKKEPAAKRITTGEPGCEFMEVGQEVVPGMRLRCICRAAKFIPWIGDGMAVALPLDAIIGGLSKLVCVSLFDLGVLGSDGSPVS